MPRRRPARRRRGRFATQLDLFTYALSRLPPRQLPLLGLYSYMIVYLCGRGFLDRVAAGKAGTALVGVLTMVTGLLLSYRFSSAVIKWDEGKKVWAGVRGTVRDGVRMLSIGRENKLSKLELRASSTDSSSSADLVEDANEKDPSEPSIVSSPNSTPSKRETKYTVEERVDELTGLIVGFAFALQHHLHQSRPLPQPPLCDLLPVSYLSSLKRTEARVRFAEMHAGPSSSTSPNGEYRPGLRRRSTGPPSEEEQRQAGLEDWDLSTMASTAEEAISKLAAGSVPIDEELRQQLDQLNIPDYEKPKSTTAPYGQMGNGAKPKSNLTAPHPANLPLALLKLMEAYVTGLSEVPAEEGGWAEAKRERALAVVKALSGHLGEAERLSSNAPPLPLTLHLSHLLLIYLAALPVSLLCVVSGPYLIMITLIAGWCLLGLDALVSEVGGVFGPSENHHPLPQFANQILLESLDICPTFLRAYRKRLVARVGEDDIDLLELDRRCRRSGEEWMPKF